MPERREERRAVLFDLDGTLVDSFAGIASAYHHVLGQLELDDVDDREIATFIGPPIQVVLAERFGLAGSRLDAGIRAFRHHYGSEGLFRFDKYPGVDELLQTLHQQDYELCIATSKLRSMAVDVVDHAGWSSWFSVVGGAVPHGSPHLKPDVIEWTIAMVGDRAADIEGGRSLGLTGIGVTWGYGSAAELTDAGAFAIVDSTAALHACIERLS
jgi:phosphoglycolate phosphatase